MRRVLGIGAAALCLVAIAPARAQPDPEPYKRPQLGVGQPKPEPAPEPATTEQPKPESPAEPEPQPDEAMLGGPGESCRARVDCKGGLKCVANVCTDPNAPAPAPQPVVVAPPPAPVRPPPPLPPPPEPMGPGWLDHEIFQPGMRPFVGIAIMPGISVLADYGFGLASDAEASLIFAFRGGLLFERTALAVEIAPALHRLSSFGQPNLSLLVSLGHYVQIAGPVYYPIRFGTGIAASNIPGPNDIALQLQADLIGVAFNVGHVMIELNLPSYRFYTDFDQIGVMGAMFGIGANYVF